MIVILALLAVAALILSWRLRFVLAYLLARVFKASRNGRRRGGVAVRLDG
jgi:hypothetical protein